jgi:hypothetical protein
MRSPSVVLWLVANKANPLALILPQHRRTDRKLVHAYALKQGFIQDRRYEVGRERGQVEHAAHIAVIDLLAGGEFGDRFCFAGFEHGQPAMTACQRQLHRRGGAPEFDTFRVPIA